MGSREMTDGAWAEDTAKAEALNALMQAIHVGGIALDAIARGEVPAEWDEIAEALATTQDAFRAQPARFTGLVVNDADVAALARLRALVASGVIGEDARALAREVRVSLDKAPPRAA
jgi:hypothetical protein